MRFRNVVVMLLGSGMLALGQPAPARPGRMMAEPELQPAPPARPPHPREHGLQAGPGGKWWDNPEMAKKLGITADQQKKMDDVFQQIRLRLIDLHAAVEREEAILEPMMQGEQLDDSKILPQIDRISQARAELEKANARLYLGIRHVLTPAQWRSLESERPPHPPGAEPPADAPPPGRPRRL